MDSKCAAKSTNVCVWELVFGSTDTIVYSTFAVKDSTGQTAFTDQVTVRQGNDQGFVEILVCNAETEEP